jgi:hypothetical protein
MYKLQKRCPSHEIGRTLQNSTLFDYEPKTFQKGQRTLPQQERRASYLPTDQSRLVQLNPPPIS